MRLVIPIVILLIASSFAGGYFYGTHASRQTAEKKVTGIGGVFFKCKDPNKLKEWYNKNLGLNTDKYGTTFEWRISDKQDQKGYTQWAPFIETTKYFNPSDKQFMINYRGPQASAFKV